MKKILLILTLSLTACAGHVVKQPKTASWDQENLKQNDHGCPTAIFIAPGGNLKQCDD